MNVVLSKVRLALVAAVGLYAALCASAASAESVDELVEATPEELAQKREQAQNTADALQAVLASAVHGDDQVGLSKADHDSSRSKSIRAGRIVGRDETVRPNDDSFGAIPGAATKIIHPDQFQVIQNEVMGHADIAGILPKLKSYVESHPEHRAARLMLARIQVVDHDTIGALATLRPLLSLHARQSHPDWQPWFWAGTAYLQSGEVELARQNLDVALTKSSTVAAIWVQLAVLEQELDNHAGALQYLEIAQRLEPRKAAIHLNRAYSLEWLGDFEQALGAYRQFLVSEMQGADASLRPEVLRRIATIAATVDVSQVDHRQYR